MSQFKIRELDIAFALFVLAPLFGIIPIFRLILAMQNASQFTVFESIFYMTIFAFGFIIAPVIGFIFAYRNRGFKSVIILGYFGLFLAFIILLANLRFLDILPNSINTLFTYLTGFGVFAYLTLGLILGIGYLIKRANLIQNLDKS